MAPIREDDTGWAWLVSLFFCQPIRVLVLKVLRNGGPTGSKRMLSAFFAAPLQGATPDDSAAQRTQMTRLDGIKSNKKASRNSRLRNVARQLDAAPAAADAAIAVRLAFTIEGVEHKLGSV